MDSVEDGIYFGSLGLVPNPVSQQGVARVGLGLHDALLGITRDLDVGYPVHVDDFINKSAIFGGEVIKAHDILAPHPSEMRDSSIPPLGCHRWGLASLRVPIAVEPKISRALKIGREKRREPAPGK